MTRELEGNNQGEVTHQKENGTKPALGSFGGQEKEKTAAHPEERGLVKRVFKKTWFQLQEKRKNSRYWNGNEFSSLGVGKKEGIRRARGNLIRKILPLSRIAEVLEPPTQRAKRGGGIG